MKKIKTALIGLNLNSHSSQIYRSIAKQNDIFDVAGCVLPENEKYRLKNKLGAVSCYNELTLDEVLNNPEIEAVIIETDEIFLTKYAIMAARAGKHIHMEKPGGTDLADFEELIGIIKNTGKVFHTGYMYRYNPYVTELMHKIQNDELGEIISVEAQMNCILPYGTRQWLEDLPGGMMFYLGCHLVDLVLQIKGHPDRIISLNKSSGMDGVTAKDFGMAVFEYENGISFVKTAACEIGGYARRQLVVSGTKGTVELKPFEMFEMFNNSEMHYTIKTEYDSVNWNDMGKKSKSEMFNRYDCMMKSFAEYVRGEKPNPYTPDYELELFKTILKACGQNSN